MPDTTSVTTIATSRFAMQLSETLWHGFPIKWSDLPTDAKNQLIAKGRLTNKQYKKALRKPLELEFGS